MDVANVKIWGTFVGAVLWNEKTAYSTFEYAEKFRQNKWDLSPLKMPINTTQRIFTFPEFRHRSEKHQNTFEGLPGLLADALPDHYGNQLMNVWLAQEGRAENSMNPIEKLCFMGKRGMGALEFEPIMFDEQGKLTTIEIESLVDTAQKVLSDRADFITNLNKDEEEAVRNILRIGTSAGGARPKALIAWNEKTAVVKSGQTETPKGFEHWLLKLDGVSDMQLGSSYGYGRVEMAYYNMARDCGITMMPSRLLEESGRAHFMTKRFDRDGNTKHHIQTFCAIKHYDYNLVNSFSYEQLFQCMRELKLSYADAEQMFKRMVFNVISRNCDDHTKNFSFIMKQDEPWKLAPAYDLCHAYRPDSEWVSQHALSINGKRKDINKADLLQIGKSINCKNAAQIVAEINDTVSQWKSYAKDVGVSENLSKSIGKTILNLN